jgi:hypothetical protein
MMKPPICCQTERPGPKASKAKMLTKRIAAIQRMRGAQCSNFFVFIVSGLTG